jgi:adenylate cyclase class 2
LTYEVEQKFPVGGLEAATERLRQFGAEPGAETLEVDRYYAHPARDFAASDEALRIRRGGQRNYITYKGPKVDQTTKTRREIELPLDSGRQTPDQWNELLEALGFRLVAEVRKHRRKVELQWQGRAIEATLDCVDRVGTFVELEASAGDDDLDDARAAIGALAEHLGLGQTERRSYLELLLEASDGGQSD